MDSFLHGSSDDIKHYKQTSFLREVFSLSEQLVVLYSFSQIVCRPITGPLFQLTALVRQTISFWREQFAD